MVRVCAFPGCFNREKPLRLRPQGSAQEESLTFHTLPLHDPERLQLWLLALRRDIHSPIESIRALRVCSDHFSPDDFPGPNRRYLKSTAVPGQFAQTKLRPAEAKLHMKKRFGADMDSVASPEDKKEFSFVTLTSGANPEQYGEMSLSQSTEAGSPPSSASASAAGFSLESDDSTEAGMKEVGSQESLMQQKDVVELQKDLKQEDVDLRLHQDKHAEAASETGKDKPIDEEINTEDTAQCSEELVIAKVEDFTNEMAISEDYTEHRSERMEVDNPENAETQTAENVKNRMMQSSVGKQTQPELTLNQKKLPEVQPAVVPPVKIKDEPVDEECRKAPQSPVENIKDDEDLDQRPDEIKGRAAFSVGGNATSIGAPAAASAMAPSVPAVSVPAQAPFKQFGQVCAGCKRVMLKEHTAFQRSGSPKLYCSPQCLCITTAIVVKKKTCHHCLKEILDPKDLLFAPVDRNCPSPVPFDRTSGTTKEFCSQKCISAFNFRCSVCQKTGVTHGHEVKSMGSIHKLCSDGCFNKFLSSNKLTMNCCMNCGQNCKSTDGPSTTLQIEGSVVKFCTQKCLTAYKKKSLKTVACKVCGTMRQAADMLEGLNSEGIKDLFCSTSCAMTSKIQTVSSSGAAVECKNCKKILVPQYHLAMFDGTVENFCSFSCVVSYQESFNKTKSHKEANKVTTKSSNTPTSTPAAPKPAPAESSSSAKTPSESGQSVTKLPCAQCLESFFHKPELLEFKRKMYVFCDNNCVEEFRKTNNITARCEYCKIMKAVRIVKRMNKVDRFFCGEKCKSLFEENQVKNWGRKHCRDCFYCDAASKTLVTGVFNDKKEMFCGNQCLSKYTDLIRQEMKCTMCKQAKVMTETVKWLGEVKHFCSLRCLMFFCSLQAITGVVTKSTSKILPTQGATCVSPVSPAVHQSTKEATPVIVNVTSLSNAANGQPGVLKNTDLEDAVPSITVEIPDDVILSEKRVSTQKRTARTSAPQPRVQKNRALTCDPKSKNKATSCKPNTCDAQTQSDEMPKVIVLPVPVPVYVPVPMHLYTQYVPQSVGFPLPVPVPLFLPTTLDSAEHIVKTIQEIKEKIPDDPLEAELIMMAEMVAEDAEKEKRATSSDQTANLIDDLDLEDLSSSLSWEEDSVSSAQTWDQTPDLEKPPLSKSATLTPISTPVEEPQMDLEADFPVESIELLRGQAQQRQQVSDYGKRKRGRRGHDDFPQKKRVSKCTAAKSDSMTNPCKLQHEYGVSAWKNWVRWRNSQPPKDIPKFGSRSMTLKEDLLKCSTAELSYGLSKFISEVRRPNGEKYSPDSIFYLCLGIQQHLFENDRMENVFADVLYSKFCQDMTNMLKGWTPTILPSGYVHSRVEEGYLWDCKQLGAFSPGVLLNTLLYFFTKFFDYKTVAQHRRLSFSHLKRYSRGQANSKVVHLRFYPHQEDTNTDSVPAKRRKKEDEKGKMLRIRENSENPFRCPVRLYEFYLSKCSPSVRHSTSQFYLNPERSCVPNSPTWFSTSSLSDEALESMLTRILTVRELHLEESPQETESDTDSD